jgi:hypothetical protein
MTSATITAALNFAITSTGCTKNEAITAVIRALIDAGMPARTAFDAVIGAGSFEALMGEVWEALQPA